MLFNQVILLKPWNYDGLTVALKYYDPERVTVLYVHIALDYFVQLIKLVGISIFVCCVRAKCNMHFSFLIIIIMQLQLVQY